MRDYLAPSTAASECHQLGLRSSDSTRFFPDDITPKQFLADENVRDEVEGCLRILQNEGVWVEAIVTKDPKGGMQIVNTQVNEY